ncbi:insulinase family protein [Candidatus Pacearchaeota archaeon]|nr:insulinase family protein [Candidatus Pacearchaeota archaeon]
MKFLRRKLKNGITVIMEQRELPVVSLSISNKFGAGFEKSDIKGVAHFIEHLVFNGTKTRTHEDISREIEKRGGILNAFTSHELTSFWVKLPSDHLFVGLDILSDILINPILKEDKFAKEKKVILEEIKMYHDTPQRFIYDLIEGNLYEKPFGDSVIGSKETVSSLERDYVYSFFRENYLPENFIVTIVGNAEIDKVCEYLEKNFSEKRREIGKFEIKKKNRETIEERGGIDQAHFLIGMHAPLMREKDYAALEILNAYLADGASSKLFLKIREDKGLAYAVRGNINAEKSYSYYTIYIGTTKEALPEIKKIILDEFDNVGKMDEKELEETKEQLIGQRKISTEESVNVMNELLICELSGKAEDYYIHEKRIKAVSLEQVKKLASDLIKKYSIAAIVPKDI